MFVLMFVFWCFGAQANSIVSKLMLRNMFFTINLFAFGKRATFFDNIYIYIYIIFFKFIAILLIFKKGGVGEKGFLSK
jgi:hypothetical protein